MALEITLRIPAFMAECILWLGDDFLPVAYFVLSLNYFFDCDKNLKGRVRRSIRSLLPAFTTCNTLTQTYTLDAVSVLALFILTGVYYSGVERDSPLTEYLGLLAGIIILFTLW